MDSMISGVLIGTKIHMKVGRFTACGIRVDLAKGTVAGEITCGTCRRSKTLRDNKEVERSLALMALIEKVKPVR